MQAYLLEWLHLLLRWAHVAAAMAWIGASFYFFRMERALGRPAEPQWLKWPAYGTWLAGFALLALMYYASAEAYLIEPEVLGLSRAGAIGWSLAYLVAGLALYEGICRSPLGRREAALDAALLVFFAALAWSLAQVFSGRGAFVHYGAVLGTIMAGNVAHVLIPAQRRFDEARREGREPDPRRARLATQRSDHNACLALPAAFAMLSAHYPLIFVPRHAWLALVAMTLAGALLARAWLGRRAGGG